MTVGICLGVSGGALMLGALGAKRAAGWWLSMSILSAVTALCAAGMVLGGWGVWEWGGGFEIGGEVVALRLDGVSAFFLALLAVVSGAGSIYAFEYWSDHEHPESAGANRAWWNGLLLCMGSVLICTNGLHFLIAWELFTLCAYFLITLDGRSREARAAGWLYLGASHAGTLVLVGFFALLAAGTGSWELGPMRSEAGLGRLFWLALLGFGVKAGLFPLHIWLPSAHANAPSHVSAILSGVAIKMGIYGIVRFSGWLAAPVAAGWLVAVLGVLSAVLGVAFALGQHDLKRLLAYHSVENIGIILIGVGFAMVAAAGDHGNWGMLAMAGALLHVWNHGLFKALLFLGAGSVVHATGTREMSRLGGLWRAMPWTASLFALGAVAISGLPPLNGFVSEWLLYLGLFDAVNQPGAAVWAAVPAIVLLAMTGGLALACFVKVCGVVFLGAARSDQASCRHECGYWMRGSMLLLAAGCIGIGLAPVAFWPALSLAVGDWNGAWKGASAPASLPAINGLHLGLAVAASAGAIWLWRRARMGGWKREVTWDCGYAAPTSRMQYTGGSFAGIITEWFGWILRPVRHEHLPEENFPRRASMEAHTPETVLEQVVEPICRWVLWICGWVRRLQNGRAQAYLFYLILGLAAVAVMTLAWSGPGWSGGPTGE